MKRIVALVVVTSAVASCSSGGSSTPAVRSGGATGQGSGGVAAGSGGSGTGAGTGGSASGTGGAGTATGGSGSPTGGASSATGGSSGSGGGAGGATASGGSSAGTGGTTTGTGGAAGTGAAGRAGGGGITGNPGTGGGTTSTGGAVACAAPVPVTAGTAVTVNVDLAAATLATVSPDLMGIHTAVYDGLLTTSPTAENLLKAAGVTSLRYPGGSYADQYHWQTHTATATPAAGAGSNVIYVDPTANFGSFVQLLQRLGANALITVNYGMNSGATGPAEPKEAAAWVAYANALPASTTPIGLDSTGRDWRTAGYWAGLRASAPLATDDGMNFLRINRAAPVEIKYWELGNELYGNGYYSASATSAGWEPDMHAPYNGTNGTARLRNAALAPTVYGAGIKAFAAAMKAVDPTIKLGGVVNDPAAESAYPLFNDGALQGCGSMDFAAVHWYPSVSTVPGLLTKARTDIPTLFSSLHSKMMMICGAPGATMPIAVTEWGPNTLYGTSAILGRTWHPAPPGTPSQTQIGGIFAAESYATFMEQGALAVHWAQLHDDQYLVSAPVNDTPGFGYHGQLIAHYLASGGDAMKPTTSTVATLLSHASLGADGGVSVMLTNTSATAAANVTVNVSGGMLACGGWRYAYTPAAGAGNLDGAVTSTPIYSATTRTSVDVAVPAYSVVVVAFPKG